MSSRQPTLAKNLTYRLTWILLFAIVINVIVVGIYYSSDRESLEREAIEKQLSLLTKAFDDTDLNIRSQAKTLFRSHPQGYAFALLDHQGNLLDAENEALIPQQALHTDLFAQHWQTRLTTPEGVTLLMSQPVELPSGTARLIFAMHNDPGHLILRALASEFLTHIWIPILPVAVMMIGANHFMIRRGLRPVRHAANWARTIQPGIPAPPIEEENLPAEIDDLVHSTQRTLERLNIALLAEQRRGAEIAHALRTPIAVLTARLALLPAGDNTEKLRTDLASLARTVHQVLACSKADALDISSESRCELNQIATRITANLAPFAYERGVTLSLRPHTNPVIVRATQEGVELALVNLVENAVLHSGTQIIEITVGPGATLSVRDEGRGIPTESFHHVFDAFWRGEEAAEGGSGLGLAIVQRLQLAQKGSVTLSTSPKGGAEFTLFYSTENDARK